MCVYVRQTDKTDRSPKLRYYGLEPESKAGWGVEVPTGCLAP